MSEHLKIDDIEIYPLEKSLSGTNAYYIHDCAAAGHTAGYCACLKKIMDHGNGRLSEIYANCGNAMDKNSCKASKMRKEEIAAGRALFYISRAKLQAQTAAENEAILANMRSREPAKSSWGKAPLTHVPPSANPQPKPSFDHGGGDYAAAINAAIQEETNKPETKLVTETKDLQPTSAPAVKPGMSLLEMAKARAAL